MTPLRIRMAELTTRGDDFNAWPDRQAIVSVWQPRPDPEHIAQDMFNFGLRLANTEMRQIRPEHIPTDILNRLPNNGKRFLHTVKFHFPPPMGQTDPVRHRNIFVSWLPSWNENFLGMSVEIGCQHHYSSTKIGNCWYRMECTNCPHYYEVDSSG